MPDDLRNQETAFKQDDTAYGKQTRAIPRPEVGVGIDTKGVFYDNIINAGTSSQLDISAIDNFSQISQTRDQVYQLLDTMSEDPTISAVLETYAEDATETSDTGRIVWCESEDTSVAQYITYLLDTIGVDKNIYKWTYALCKYGDVYLRLYRESEFQDALFDEDGNETTKKKLDEDVNIKAFSKNDKFVHYLEMVPNPAEMFELTKFGKSYAYIQAKINSNAKDKNYSLINSTYRYSFKKKDVDVYDATNFVHAALEDNSSRVPEEVQIFRTNDMDDDSALRYTVKRGQSLLYNTFKIWRELMLLENSLLLNRLTKSSIVRVINVEVGDMPKENVGPHLMGIKNLIEQKSALNEGNSMSEYTNPGPMENNIYVPTHNQLGTIQMQTVGGDVEVKGLDDIDYFKNKFFGSLRVPKQYFGETNDSTGFNGGSSLSLISSRYAKMVKRIQNTMVQALTDAINLMLLDKGLDSYINKFEIRMLAPTTQEEVDRRENSSNKVNMITDILNLLTDIEDPSAKLKITKALLSKIVTDADVLNVLQEEIDKMEEQEEMGADDEMPTEEGEEGNPLMPGSHSLPSGPSGGPELPDADENEPAEGPEAGEESNEEGVAEQILPTPEELGIDMTDSNNPELM